MQTVHGHVDGLKPSELKSLVHLYRRRLRPDQIVSLDLGRELATLSEAVRRQVGVLVDRAGAVSHVIVGDAEKLQLPDLGRARAGRQRFRGLRLVHTHLQGEPLSRDDLTDLSLLRLDLIGVVQVEAGQATTLEYATLLPPHLLGDGGAYPWRKEGPVRLTDVSEDFAGLIRALEGEFAAAGDARRTSDRPRAILVGVELGRGGDAERRMAELERLAQTAGLEVIDTLVQRRPQLDPRTVVGKGKLDDLLVRSMYLEADLLVFDRDLTPSQGRTLAERTELKVIDRTQLILDIFAQHAQSPDGKLQVELAQLKYLLPRLGQMQKSLSRLTGGIGGRGPGETTLEIRSRIARDRIAMLERQLKNSTSQRELRRALRQRQGVPIASLIGYTNAGKSTLLNALTKSDVVAEDKLFATLDTTSRQMRFPDAREVVITDTVGFIEHLPKDLMRAFQATLEELRDAALLLHVVDAGDPWRRLHEGVVDEVLGELGLDAVPRLLILNKIDTVPADERAALVQETGGIPVSALDREGLPGLMAALEAALWRQGHGDVRPPWRRELDAQAE